ncbi:MAG: hypothetical protein HY808_12535 [Nitrospirae bacterium]|nr:hypothetical protein [Nitrospirota bacterium]
MTDGITVRILGDSGPFSKVGKSIGYLVTIGRSNFMLDCGAALFQQIGGQGLKYLNKLIITHCHDDHKRWFTDLVIFHRYAPDITEKVHLFASEEVTGELCRMSEPALDRTLSNDCKTIIDIPCNAYVNYQTLGPLAKYKIVAKTQGKGRFQLCVVDSGGNVIGPERAKIVISSKTNRPRLLFRDPEYKEWVEPESFYPFSSSLFYEEDKNVYSDPEGFYIEAVKSPVWHGLPNIGIKFRTASETLFFSSDTVHDTALWKELYSDKRTQSLKMSRKDFEAAYFIQGDINDYIERTWSKERYRDAVEAFKDAIVIHDVSVRDSVVHTSYNKLGNTVLDKGKTILTHSPDTLTSEWALCYPDKRFKVVRDRFFEIAGENLYPMNADIYHKEEGRYYAGYRNENGNYTVYKTGGMLHIAPAGTGNSGEILFNIDLYEDISGRYFPKLEDKGSVYIKREDGQVELVRTTAKGSRGEIVSDCRDSLVEKEAEQTNYKL